MIGELDSSLFHTIEFMQILIGWENLLEVVRPSAAQHQQQNKISLIIIGDSAQPMRREIFINYEYIICALNLSYNYSYNYNGLRYISTSSSCLLIVLNGDKVEAVELCTHVPTSSVVNIQQAHTPSSYIIYWHTSPAKILLQNVLQSELI